MSLIPLPEPDSGVIARRAEIASGLAQALGADRIIVDEDGRRAYETDALTAYRRMPLAVVLPQSTEEVAQALRYCHQHRIKVVPRGAGTSLAGGALPAEDAVVDLRIEAQPGARRSTTTTAPRGSRAASPISRSRAAVAERGFFYAPDPSSQLACTIAGNIAMNSGGAHCLKYGVTTNNVLGVKMVLMDGEIVEIGGPHLDSGGYDLLALVVGSEGQFGIVTEATVRILRAAERRAARADGLRLGGGGRRLRLRDHRGRHHSGRHRVHGQARDRGLRVLRQGRLSRWTRRRC